MRRYSAAFKERALSLLKEVGISKASSELHVTRATLCRWRTEKEQNDFDQSETVRIGLSGNANGYSFMKQYMEQTEQFCESYLSLEGKLDKLRTKAKQLNKMNSKLVSILDSKMTEND